MTGEKKRHLAVLTAMALGAAGCFLAALLTGADAHDWYPPDCCSGFDCRPLAMDDVRTTADGFVIPGNPEGGNRYHICTRGGTPEGEILCLYIPNWGM